MRSDFSLKVGMKRVEIGKSPNTTFTAVVLYHWWDLSIAVVAYYSKLK